MVRGYSFNPMTTELENAPGLAIVTAQDLTAPLAERMPPITEETSAPPPPEPTPAPVAVPSGPALYDSRRVKFSPLRHQVNADGTPKRNAKGNFILTEEYRNGKQRVRVPSANGAAPIPGGSRGEAQFSTPEQKSEPGANVPDEYDLLAEVYLQSSYGPLMLAFSPAIRPNGEEHGALKQSLAALLRHKQAKELEPTWAFALTATAVFVSKTSEPTVKEKLALYWLRVRSWFAKKKE